MSTTTWSRNRAGAELLRITRRRALAIRRAAARLARDRRRASDVVLGRQLVGISDEMQRALDAVCFAEQRLQALAPGERQAVGSEALEHSVCHARRVAHDLRDFAQARLGGGIALSLTSCDLHELVRGVLSPEALARGGYRSSALVSVEHEASGDGRARLDAKRIQQVAAHLVENAMNHATAGSTVRVCSEGHERGISLSIHHDGRPIRGDALAAVLAGSEGNNDDSHRMSSLGLYLVDHIVSAHGGRLSFHSSAAAGTWFALAIPSQHCRR